MKMISREKFEQLSGLMLSKVDVAMAQINSGLCEMFDGFVADGMIDEGTASKCKEIAGRCTAEAKASAKADLAERTAEMFTPREI